jgi:prepilin-type processing-associated H-X9-DG protein
LTAGTVEVPDSGPGKGARRQYCHSSYRGNSGYVDLYAANKTNWFGQSVDYVANPPFPFPFEWRGPLYAVGFNDLRPLKLKSITDGLSKTLLAGESTTGTRTARSTFWAYAYGGYNLSTMSPFNALLLNNYEECVAIVVPLINDNPCKFAWGSPHRDGLHFAFCDGSVSFVDTSIDMQILCDAATIANAELVRLP